MTNELKKIQDEKSRVLKKLRKLNYKIEMIEVKKKKFLIKHRALVLQEKELKENGTSSVVNG